MQRSGPVHWPWPIQVSCAWVRRQLCFCLLLSTAVAITVVVTDMVVPNTLLPISACLCGIARKIAVASKTIGCEPSATSVFCSVFLHPCLCVFVKILRGDTSEGGS